MSIFLIYFTNIINWLIFSINISESRVKMKISVYRAKLMHSIVSMEIKKAFKILLVFILTITTLLSNGTKILIIISFLYLLLLYSKNTSKIMQTIGIIIIYIVLFIIFRNPEINIFKEFLDFKVVFNSKSISDTDNIIDSFLYYDFLIINKEISNGITNTRIRDFNIINQMEKVGETNEPIENQKKDTSNMFFLKLIADIRSNKKQYASFGNIYLNELFIYEPSDVLEGSFFLITTLNNARILIYLNNHLQVFSYSDHNAYKQDFERLAKFILEKDMGFLINPFDSDNNMIFDTVMSFLKIDQKIKNNFNKKFDEVTKKSPNKSKNDRIYEILKIYPLHPKVKMINCNDYEFRIYNNALGSFVSYRYRYSYDIVLVCEAPSKKKTDIKSKSESLGND